MNWTLIDTEAPFLALCKQLQEQKVWPIDFEADSMYCYRGKICLVQVHSEGINYVIDPLALSDMTPFIEAMKGKTLLLHASEYDLFLMRTEWSFIPDSLFDTAICAKVLGYPREGLSYLIEKHFEITIDKKFQKADWSKRPLPQEWIEYAAGDTAYLIQLQEILGNKLIELRRMAWAQESFQQQLNKPVPPPDPDSWRVKGSSVLHPKELGALQILWRFREKLAEKHNLPPFKAIANPRMIELAKSAHRKFPISTIDLKRLPTKAKEEDLETLVAQINKQLELPIAEQPPKKYGDLRKKRIANTQKLEKIKLHRDSLAEKLNVAEATLGNRQQLSLLSKCIEEPKEAIQSKTGLMKWQIDTLLGQ